MFPYEVGQVISLNLSFVICKKKKDDEDDDGEYSDDDDDIIYLSGLL